MKKNSLILLITELLTEASISQLQSQFVDSGKITTSVFNEIIQASGGSGAYTTWLTKKVTERIIKPEDIYKFKKYLSIFHRRKSEFPQSDIHRYETPRDITNLIQKSLELEKLEKSDLSQQKGVSKSDKYQELYIGEVDGFKVYKLPKGRKDLYSVSCELGGGTEWCTSTGNTRQHFDSFIDKDDLYIFIKGNEKYQFHYGEGEFMDKNNISLL